MAHTGNADAVPSVAIHHMECADQRRTQPVGDLQVLCHAKVTRFVTTRCVAEGKICHHAVRRDQNLNRSDQGPRTNGEAARTVPSRDRTMVLVDQLARRLQVSARRVPLRPLALGTDLACASKACATSSWHRSCKCKRRAKHAYARPVPYPGVSELAWILHSASGTLRQISGSLRSNFRLHLTTLSVLSYKVCMTHNLHYRRRRFRTYRHRLFHLEAR